MSDKPKYPGPPPPYSQPTCNPQSRPNTQKSSSLFGGICKVLSDVGSTLDGAARDLTHAIDTASTGNLITSMCRTGNIIQLSPKHYGASIQILSDPNGYLFVDPCGPLHPQAYNTHWTVYMEPGFENVIKLYNQVNYLSVSGKQLCLTQTNNPATAPLSARFRVRQNDNCLCFESLLCPKLYITYDNTHNSIVAKDVSLLSTASYFHPTLVYSPMNPVKH